MENDNKLQAICAQVSATTDEAEGLLNRTIVRLQ
jgi:hypothetical protein